MNISDVFNFIENEFDNPLDRLKFVANFAGKDREWILNKSRENLKEIGLTEENIEILMDKIKKDFPVNESINILDKEKNLNEIKIIEIIAQYYDTFNFFEFTPKYEIGITKAFFDLLGYHDCLHENRYFQDYNVFNNIKKLGLKCVIFVQNKYKDKLLGSFNDDDTIDRDHILFLNY